MKLGSQCRVIKHVVKALVSAENFAVSLYSLRVSNRGTSDASPTEALLGRRFEKVAIQCL